MEMLGGHSPWVEIEYTRVKRVFDVARADIITYPEILFRAARNVGITYTL